MFNKSVNILMFDGNPKGIVMCELSNWNGRVYKFSRTHLKEFLKRDDSEYTGVYFLFGKDDMNNDTVYVGEAEQISNRINQHLKDKDYWTEVIVLLSKDNYLNKAHVKYLEHSFYKKAKDEDRAKLINNTVPTKSSVSEYDESMLKEFFDNSLLLISLLGKKVFEHIADEITTINNESMMYIKAIRGADAMGMLTSDGFVVFKDSQIASDTTKSISYSLLNLRNKLIEEKVIVDYKFTKDYLFTSPSLAAAIVMGRNANGRTEWRTKNKKTINDLES
ncbi:GIY-YIG nuclease family protein [uncultured Anaerofustis sp.]|uniref:GIY-YIG nuclease family protein n=1 Tax=uncultured Anaerofustis sp. TaxID=904996 RepID=UPI0025EC9663|nr:GIY-YIG nuclease family protein [uncultured Anaerofustis sp.]